MMSRLNRSRSRPQPVARPSWVGIVLVSMIGVAAGLWSGPAASGGWVQPLTGSGDVVAATLMVGVTTATRDNRIANEDYQTTQLITAQNIPPAGSEYTGTSDVTLTVDPVVDNRLAAMMSVAVWPVATAAACANTSNPPPDAAHAPFTSGLTTAAIPLAPNASALFCIRGYPTNSTPQFANADTAAAQNRSVVAAELGGLGVENSFTPRYSIELHRGHFTVTSGATTTALSRFRIFPFELLTHEEYYVGVPILDDGISGRCFMLRLEGTVRNLVTNNCSLVESPALIKNFAGVGVPGTSAFQMRGQAEASHYGFLEASADGKTVTAAVSDQANLRQRWIAQVLSNGSYQIVNAATGYCLFSSSVLDAYASTQPCNNIRGESSDWLPAPR